MMKRFAALLLALVMVMSFVFSASALIAVEDETGIRYSDGREKEGQPKEPSAFSVAVKKALEKLKTFWQRYGVVTVVVAFLAAIVIAIVVSEAERQKKEKPPKPVHHKKK